MTKIRQKLDKVINKLDIVNIAKVRQKLEEISILRKLEEIRTSEYTDVGCALYGDCTNLRDSEELEKGKSPRIDGIREGEEKP